MTLLMSNRYSDAPYAVNVERVEKYWRTVAPRKFPKKGEYVIDFMGRVFFFIWDDIRCQSIVYLYEPHTHRHSTA